MVGQSFCGSSPTVEENLDAGGRPGIPKHPVKTICLIGFRSAESRRVVSSLKLNALDATFVDLEGDLSPCRSSDKLWHLCGAETEISPPFLTGFTALWRQECRS